MPIYPPLNFLINILLTCFIIHPSTHHLLKIWGSDSRWVKALFLTCLSPLLLRLADVIGPFWGCLSSHLGQHKDSLWKAHESWLPGSGEQRTFSAEGSSGEWQCFPRKRGRFHTARLGTEVLVCSCRASPCPAWAPRGPLSHRSGVWCGRSASGSPIMLCTLLPCKDLFRVGMWLPPCCAANFTLAFLNLLVPITTPANRNSSWFSGVWVCVHQ